MNLLTRLARHLWLDAGDARHAVDASALQRLEAQVRDSEARHTGEICICVEASLPLSYLWRHLRGAPIDRVVEERALMQFSKLRVWDTELNNGVLIYLQLAEHQIEIVADRALARKVDNAHWQKTLADLAPEFRAGHYEAGLRRAIEAVGHALETHFPTGQPAGDVTESPEDQLPNRPVVG